MRLKLRDQLIYLNSQNWNICIIIIKLISFKLAYHFENSFDWFCLIGRFGCSKFALFFENLQSEFFRKLDQIHLNKINYVGTVERLNEFISLLCYRLGFSQPNESSIIKENSNSRTYGLDIKDESICRALQPLIGWDKLIYNQARHRFIDDLHQYLVELEKSKGPRFWLKFRRSKSTSRPKL